MKKVNSILKNIRTFDLSIAGIVIRFYLMMAVVIGAGFSGYWLFGLLALPIFLSIMLGVTFNFENSESLVERKIKMENKKRGERAPSEYSPILREVA